MTKEQILQEEHELLHEILSIAWEDDKIETKAQVAIYACGIHDLAHQLLLRKKEKQNV